MKSSILIVGHPHPEQVEFGADFCSTFDEALDSLNKNPYAVLVVSDRVPKSKEKSLSHMELLQTARKVSPELQIVFVSDDSSPQDLQKTINLAGIFKVLPDFDGSLLQLAVREALEEFELIKQNQAFLNLTQEQNQKLQQMSTLLENKVKAREKFLIDARAQLLVATKKTEALNRALVAIQKSETKQEMEYQINEALTSSLGLAWTRILFRDQSFLEQVPEAQSPLIQIFTVPLFRGKELLGHIYFAKKREQADFSEEEDFLLQLGDAVALSMDRLLALADIEALKKEWDSTFDAITDPVALITEDYQILRANKSYAQKARISLEDMVGKKCFELLFQRNAPCTHCHLGESFDLGEQVCSNESVSHFKVNSHAVDIGTAKKTYALFYRDMSEEMRIQRQILESSKMAEIGTIGSSIAHEINNPLGGIIAFLQILKSETKGDEKFHEDIVAMEQSAARCKSIVENLLAFTRKSVSSEMNLTRVSELIKLVTNIMELQTRSIGIKIEKVIQNPDALLKADTNQLVQVLVNVMQNSCESLAEKMSQKRGIPLISIKTYYTDETKAQLAIEVTDFGTGIRPEDLPRVFTPFFTTKDKAKNPGLGLSVSYQIVKDHGGQMEISSIFGKSTTVLVTLPVAKSPTRDQNFD